MQHLFPFSITRVGSSTAPLVQRWGRLRMYVWGSGEMKEKSTSWVTVTVRVWRMDSEIFQCVIKNTVLDLSTVPYSKVKKRIPRPPLSCVRDAVTGWLNFQVFLCPLACQPSNGDIKLSVLLPLYPQFCALLAVHSKEEKRNTTNYVYSIQRGDGGE